MTRTKSLGSHRLRRCTDVLYIPSSALPVDDRHVISCGESRRTQSDLPWERPVHGDRDVARGAAMRNIEGRDRAEADRSAESGERGTRLDVPAKHRPVAAGVGLEEVRQLARERG